jgi:hypothetical protein
MLLGGEQDAKGSNDAQTILLPGNLSTIGLVNQNGLRRFLIRQDVVADAPDRSSAVRKHHETTPVSSRWR